MGYSYGSWGGWRGMGYSCGSWVDGSEWGTAGEVGKRMMNGVPLGGAGWMDGEWGTAGEVGGRMGNGVLLGGWERWWGMALGVGQVVEGWWGNGVLLGGWGGWKGRARGVGGSLLEWGPVWNNREKGDDFFDTEYTEHRK
ncbi:unnamed protein product [Lepidochelys kempii]